MIRRDVESVELSGFEHDTTNQRMELKAAIEGLSLLEEPGRVTLHSDSAYLIDCMNDGWHEKWRENGWRNAQKKLVKNQDLWQELVRLSELHDVMWVKVKGHSGIPENERCDSLVRMEMRRTSKS